MRSPTNSPIFLDLVYIDSQGVGVGTLLRPHLFTRYLLGKANSVVVSVAHVVESCAKN